MTVHQIDRLDDERIAPYRGINRANPVPWSKWFIVEGEKVVRRLLESPLGTESVLAARSVVDRVAFYVPPDVPLMAAEDELLREIVGFRFHRGVLACGLRPANKSLADFVPPPPKPAVVIVCSDVHDPENLGGILRIASTLAATGMVVGHTCADPFSRRVVRVSMGAALVVPLVQTRDVAGEIDRLGREHAVTTIATVLNAAAQPLHAMSPVRRAALVFGSEGHGLTPEVVARCDRRVTIPMRPGTDSLNVAVAAGIFMHHFALTTWADAADPPEPGPDSVPPSPP
jgi:tRNA G18 (ribose-2'-O)-methylase SpoU